MTGNEGRIPIIVTRTISLALSCSSMVLNYSSMNDNE